MTELTKSPPPESLFHKHPFLGLTVLFTLLAAFYWGVWASDRYVSEAHVIIQQADLNASQSMDLGGLLLGSAGVGNQADQLLLRDYLLSVDMLKTLNKKLNLRSHYSDFQYDFFSRMWFEDAPIESFHAYYLTRIHVDFDEYSGILIIKAEAYTKEMAHIITSTLVSEGEKFMNELARELAYEQVNFLETQVDKISQRVIKANQALLNFQNRKGLASPQTTAENFVGIISRMEGQLADMQTQKNALLGYLKPNSSNVVELNLQIEALKRQINIEKGRLTSKSSHSKSLNKTVEEYQRLQLNAEFAQDVYKTTLVAMEKGRIEASRTLKKMSILQKPTVPEYPLEPQRIYNIIVFILVISMSLSIISLLNAVIIDHQE